MTATKWSVLLVLLISCGLLVAYVVADTAGLVGASNVLPGLNEDPPEEEDEFDEDEDEDEDEHEGDELEHVERMVEMLRLYGKLTFDPEQAGLVAVSSIADSELPEEQRARELELLLKKTRTLGLRNAIRLALKDVYLGMDQPDKALGHLRELLGENDAALGKRPPTK